MVDVPGVMDERNLGHTSSDPEFRDLAGEEVDSDWDVRFIPIFCKTNVRFA